MNIFVLAKQSEKPRHETPIILVHGSWGASWMWNTYIKYLTDRGWNVYAPDLRGHGKSGGSVSGATMEDYVDDMHTVMVKHNLGRPVMVGHSMGGLVTLMCAVRYGARAVVAIDTSPPKEILEKIEMKTYPEEYTPAEVGMPTDPIKVMEAFPDLSRETLMSMRDMLGKESGVARSERKRGISIPKENLAMPVLFVGGEKGESVPFGIGIKTARKMGDYYDKEVVEIKGATHPGILMGEHATEAAGKIESWLIAHI